MTFDEMVTAVRVEGGVDTVTGAVTADQVKARLNGRYRKMVADARFRMEEVSLGPTVAAQVRYDLPADIVEVDGMMVDAQPYTRQGTRTLWRLKNGDSRLRGRGGVFAPVFSSTGGKQFELFPAPDTDGLSITALAAVQATALDAGTDEPIVPEDYHDAIVEGAIADILLRLDQRQDLAAPFEQKFTDAVAALTRRTKAQLQSGPSQILVAGYHI